jgi:UDP-N-acetylglucosamine 2-epimerase (non-hydrolysing)
MELIYISMLKNKKIKILFVFGTRPEAIKLAPVIKEFQKNNKLFETKICVTAQHRELLDQVLDLFEIKPEFDLNVMEENQDLYELTSKILLRLKDIFKFYKADLVFVQGDTTTAFAGCLASFYQKIPVAHVEAGLRTYDIYSPFPEEINRQLISRIATYHFAPTSGAKNNLIKEGIKEDRIIVSGNTVVDALLYILKKIKNKKIEIDGYRVRDKKYILVTAHRRENFGERFLNICQAIKEIAISNPEVDIVYPVHPNPNVRVPAYKILNNIPNVYLIKPLDYLQFVYLMSKAFLILTDSGGVQEEASCLGKPVLVMRGSTERIEGVKAGLAKLVGTDKNLIIEEIQKLINNEKEYKKMSEAKYIYGDGKASKRIVNFIKKAMGLK